jgi:N-methylhydantoinase A
MVANFHDAYEERSLNRFESMPVQGVTYRVNAIVPTAKVRYPDVLERDPSDPLEASRSITLRYLSDEDVSALEYQREDLRAGDRIAGPAVIREALSTTFLEAGHVATVGRLGELIIVRETAA